jgi:hypothetical protein
MVNNMADNDYELEDTDGPKTYHIDEKTLDTVSEDVTKYQGIEYALMIVEDNDKHRKLRVDAAKSVLGNDVELCVCSNTLEAQEELKKYHHGSPNARLDFLLDYNMGESKVSRKSAEGLYIESPHFLHYLNNNCVVIFNTANPNQVKQGPEIMSTQHNYENVLFLIADKNVELKLESILNIYKVSNEEILQLRETSKKFNYDLSAIFAAKRARAKRRK